MNAVLGVCTSLFLLTCGSKQTKSLLVGSLPQKAAKLYLNPTQISSTPAENPLYLYYVNRSNALTPLNAQVSADRTQLVFPWEANLLQTGDLKDPQVFFLDLFLNMGKNNEYTSIVVNQDAGNQAKTHQMDLVLTTLDLLQANPTAGAKVPFQRLTVRLQRQDRFSTTQLLELNTPDAPVEWNEVTFALAQVKNPQKEPLSGANLFVFNLDDTQNAQGKAQPIWTLPQYKPIAYLTSGEGKALVGPIYKDAQTARFQWFVQKDGLCLTLTNPQFTKDLSETRILASQTVETCETAVDFKGRLSQKFLTKVTLSTSRSRLVAGGKETYYTNEAQESFAIKLEEPVLRGFKVVRTELTADDARTTASDPVIFNYFQPNVTLDTYDKFSKSGGTTGRFLVEFFTLPSGNQDPAVGDASKAFGTFLFDKSTTLPKFNVTGTTPDTTLVSPTGVANTVEESGSAYSLKVVSEKCAEGWSFGALLGEFNLESYTYFPCQNGAVEIPWLALKSSQKGETTIKLSLKNVYGNVSAEEPTITRTTVTVK